ncbi:hypothetical protein [Nostocoides australiense]
MTAPPAPVLTEWAGSRGRAALPYDPRFVPAVNGGAQAERARMVCTTKFAESPEQPAIPKDAPALAVEKRDGLFMVLVGDESSAGLCLFDKATLADPTKPAAWDPVQLTSGVTPPVQIGPRDIGDVSGAGYGRWGDPGEEMTWSVAAVEGYAGAEVRGIAAVTPRGRLTALMIGRWFTIWWPSITHAGRLTYELLLADGSVVTVTR